MSMLPNLAPEVEASAPGGQDFDPAAYLAKKRQQAGFDPAAYLAAKKAQLAASAPQVGGGETYLNKTADALPLGRQLVNLLTTAGLQSTKVFGGLGKPGARLTPQAKEEMRLLGMEVPEEKNAIPGPVDTYRKVRSDFADRTAAGTVQNPVEAGLGTATGLGLSLLAPLPKVAVGGKAAGMGQRLLSSIATGAAYGGLNGAANSKGDLTQGEVGQVASDALGVGGLQNAYGAAKDGKIGTALLDLLGSGALGGGAAGGVIGAAGETARATGVTQRAADFLKRFSLDKGRKVLTNGADQLSSRTPVPDAAVEEAIRSRAIRPMGTNQGAAERLDTLVNQTGDEYGKLISALEAKGVKGPDARKVADQLLNKGAGIERNTLNNALPEEYLKQAENLLGKAGPNGELGLKQAENLKRSAQDMARYGKLEDTPLNDVRKSVASTIRGANEQAIADAAAANPDLEPLASQFVPVKQRLGNLLEAESAAQRGAARGAQRGAGSDFGIKASAAAVASGQPALIPAAMASNFAKARLPSTLASGGLRLSDLLRTPSRDGSAAQIAELIANALRDDDKSKALAEALRSAP